ncbi:MAG TPA: hypothetical protein VGE02_04230 [Gemmatimonadales bacterium]
MRLRFIPFALAAAGALSACSDPLSVANTNNPDVDRTLSSADGIEGLFRSSFQQVFSATHGSTTSIYAALQVMSGESYATVANFGMAQRSAIPRPIIDNTRGNQTASENNRDFTQLQRYARNAANGITALDALKEKGGSLGSAEDDATGRAWGWFSLGVALGNVSLMYDQASIPMPGLPSDSIPQLVPYAEVNAAALAALDSAIAMANLPAAADMAIPDEWIPTGSGLDKDQFVRLARSYKARLRAGVARTPEERAAVNWSEVAADAAAGITSDVVLNLNNSEGWGFSWLNQALVNSTWSSITPIYLGMADTSGKYRAWIRPPLEDLEASVRATGGTPGDFFLFHTPDDRFPKGATLADQQASSPKATAGTMPSVYFRARPPGDNTQGQAWGESPYDFMRFSAYRAASSVGPWVLMDYSEMAMLRAEADMRQNPGSPTVALGLINAARTAHGLPAFPAGSTRDTRAPNHPGGGSFSCVPQTPTGGGRVVECGTLWEAMKYEKRIETMFTGYGQWFTDHRGWGDLVVGTPTMYPVPYQEMDARRMEFYNSQWKSGTSTYDF